MAALYKTQQGDKCSRTEKLSNAGRRKNKQIPAELSRRNKAGQVIINDEVKENKDEI